MGTGHLHQLWDTDALALDFQPETWTAVQVPLTLTDAKRRRSMWRQIRRCGKTLDWGYPMEHGRKRNTGLTTSTALVLTGSACIGDGF